MKQANVLQGFIELLQRRYQLEVVASSYAKVDEQEDIYLMMLDVRLQPEMLKAFKKKYYGKDNNGYVEWSYFDDRICFYAEMGNDILTLLDTIVFEHEEPQYVKFRLENTSDILMNY